MISMTCLGMLLIWNSIWVASLMMLPMWMDLVERILVFWSWLNKMFQVDAVLYHGWLVWIIKMNMLMVLTDPGFNWMAGLSNANLTTLTGMLYTPSVCSPRPSLNTWRKLEIFLNRRPTNLMLCLYRNLLMQLKVILIKGEASKAGSSLGRVTLSGGLRAQWIFWYPFCLKRTFRNSSSSQRALALCTTVESMACLLDEWWWELEFKLTWYWLISSIHYVPDITFPVNINILDTKVAISSLSPWSTGYSGGQHSAEESPSVSLVLGTTSRRCLCNRTSQQRIIWVVLPNISKSSIKKLAITKENGEPRGTLPVCL